MAVRKDITGSSADKDKNKKSRRRSTRTSDGDKNNKAPSEAKLASEYMQRHASHIIEEDAVVRRLSHQSALSAVTSNSTIAAAVMVLAAVLAVVVANSHFYEPVHEFIETPIGFHIGSFQVGLSIEVFVNDFLMALFFLLVGIELKYEMTVGELRQPRQALLPMLAAVGGVAAPALIFLLFNRGIASHGWAIPIATDIAFALGVMSLLGNRVAPETKVFFQTLAIADDILAIVVLALFYGQSVNIAAAAAAFGMIVILWSLNRAHVYSAKPYMVVFLFLWVFMFNSGIHATLAGVIVGFALPSQSDVKMSEMRDWLSRQARTIDDHYDSDNLVLGQHEVTQQAWYVERVLHHVTPPLQRIERMYSVPVNFIVLPLFAFVNAQVRLVGVDPMTIVSSHVAQGVFLGAVIGKPLGIIGITLLLVKIRFAELPNRVTWKQVICVGFMGGIGFTMSILIAGLAFPKNAMVMQAKAAILVAAVVASALGLAYLHIADALDKYKKDKAWRDADKDLETEAS